MTPRQAHRLAILIVDDDAATRRALLRHLRHHVVTEADSCAAAFEALARLDTLDVIISEYDLGDGHTGIGVLAEAKRQFPAALRILASGAVDTVPMAEARQVAALVESKCDTGFARMLGEL